MYLLTPAFSGTIGLIFLTIWLGLVVFSLFHILLHKEIDRNNKILWIAIVLVVPIGGALVYLFWRSVKRVAN